MTLGSLWQLFERETKGWMVGGTVAVLAGVALGLAPPMGYPAGGDAALEVLLPSLFLCLGGGYAVLFPGVRVSRIALHVVRDWKLYPPSGQLLWILAHVTAVTGLAVCIVSHHQPGGAGAAGLAVYGPLPRLHRMGRRPDGDGGEHQADRQRGKPHRACRTARLTLERQPDQQRFVVQFDAEAFLDAGPHVTGDGQDILRAGSAAVGDREGVLGGQRRPPG